MTKPRPFGHYFILEKIAQGGMAEIFKGLTYDFSGLKKFIVIKRILPHIAANRNFIKMLIDEAKIAVKLNHGNIAQTYDLGKVADDYFIVMEFVDGRTLSQIFKKSVELKQPIPLQLGAFVAAEICNGLDYMHRARDETGVPLEIVHRDISPQNVILSYSGNVKIVDFGVAKAAFKLSEMERGVLKGKFAYMSPEQTEGDHVDARSDIFATGTVLWELLTSRRLFKKKTNAETLDAVQKMAIYPPSAYRNEIPSELDEIVMRSLERDPERRYTSATDMGLALTKFLLKHYPEFKPGQVGDFLQEVFQDDDQTADLYQEKTMREELTELESQGTGDDFANSVDETMIIDPQELDFHSVFEEIDVEEVSEITRAIGFGENSPAAGPIGEVDFFEAPEPPPPPGPSTPPLFSTRPVRPPPKKPASLLWLLGGILAIFLIYYFLLASGPANLKIVFIPPDSSVTLDGKAVSGSSPIQVKSLPARTRHKIRVAREGYVPQEKEVFLFPGWTKTVNFHLKESKQGAFEVTSEPPNAAIFIDGQATGLRTPARLPVKDLHFPLTLGLSQGGPPQWQKRFEKPIYGVEQVSADLNKAYGTVDIETSPSGAAVFLDGKPLGKTPLFSQQLEANQKLDLRIEMKGFRSHELQLRVSPGQHQKVNHVLMVEPSR